MLWPGDGEASLVISAGPGGHSRKETLMPQQNLPDTPPELAATERAARVSVKRSGWWDISLTVMAIAIIIGIWQNKPTLIYGGQVALGIQMVLRSIGSRSWFLFGIGLMYFLLVSYRLWWVFVS